MKRQRLKPPGIDTSGKHETNGKHEANGHAAGDAQPVPVAPPPGITATELVRKSIQECRFVVQQLLAEGLTLLVASPKSGKSWLALYLAMRVAEGQPVFGRFLVAGGDVLYLALEDNDRRLKRRLQMILGPDQAAPARLTLHTVWPKLNEGGLQFLAEWCQRASPSLIIIDTLAIVRPTRKPNTNAYEQDYEALRGLHQLAAEKHVSIVCIHHTRKRKRSIDEDDDVFDEVSGTQALTGCVDATLLLHRQRHSGTATLHTTGRDLPEQKMFLQWDASEYRWLCKDVVSEIIPAFGLQREILELLKRCGPLGPAETAKRLGRTSPKGKSSVKVSMWRMGPEGSGALLAEGGKYRLSAHILAAMQPPRGNFEGVDPEEEEPPHDPDHSDGAPVGQEQAPTSPTANGKLPTQAEVLGAVIADLDGLERWRDTPIAELDLSDLIKDHLERMGIHTAGQGQDAITEYDSSLARGPVQRFGGHRLTADGKKVAALSDLPPKSLQRFRQAIAALWAPSPAKAEPAAASEEVA